MNSPADPAGFRKNVVPVRLARCNQLVAHLHRKRQIRELISVQMSKLTPADTEFNAAESVRTDGHAGPAGDGLLDLRRDASHATSLALVVSVTDRPYGLLLGAARCTCRLERLVRSA